MSYYLYENWQAGPHKAVLHKSACRFCNDGSGIRGGTDPRFGKWHGPFSNLGDARSMQGRLRVEIRIDHTCVSRR